MTGVLNHLIDAVFSLPVFILLATLVLWKLVMAIVIVWRMTDV